MKHLLILLTIGLLMMNCKVRETPEFLRVQNIKVSKSTSKVITVTADAFFKNPNDIGGQLQTDGIKVLVNGKEMATVSAENFKVPAKKEFSIPLKADIATDSITKNMNLKSLLGSLLQQKLNVQYKGDIKYKVLGFSHSYTVDETETVKIKL